MNSNFYITCYYIKPFDHFVRTVYLILLANTKNYLKKPLSV